jgi:glycerol kinase
MAFGTAELMHAMLAATGLPLPALRVDGGASANDWLMQYQADVLGVPVERPDMVETTALGAAALAGLALGVWPSIEAFRSSRTVRRFEPRGSRSERDALLAGWARAVEAAKHWARSG